LKEPFTTAPILLHFDFAKEILVDTDASDIASAGILSQPGSDRLLHPIAFFSKKHTPSECNYDIYDKELMAMVRAFEEWRAYLVGRPVTVQLDHQNLRYFTTKRLLNQRQARWSEFLSQFNYTIEFVPGKAHGKVDALMRIAGHTEEEVLEDETHRTQVVLKSQSLGLWADIPLEFGASPLNELWTEAYQADPLPNQILTMLEQQVRHSRLISLAECTKDGNGLQYQDRLYDPTHQPLKLAIIQENHDAPAAGHCGRSKTHELIMRRYHWPSMRKEITRYMANCHICQHSRTTRQARFGILEPLSIPNRPGQDISMDFVTGLPSSNGNDAIWVVVDRLTKMRHLVPCRTTIDAPSLADLFLDNIGKHQGLPLTIISDREPQFAAEFWGTVCNRLKIDRRLCTAFHPETNGQTERVNSIMEQYLQSYVNYQQDDWCQWLPMGEFMGNNHASETTGTSPFFAISIYDFRIDFLDEQTLLTDDQ